MNLLYNPLSRLLTSVAHVVLWPIRATLGRVVRMAVAPYILAPRFRPEFMLSLNKLYTRCTPKVGGESVVYYGSFTRVTTDLGEGLGKSVCYTLEPSNDLPIKACPDKLSHMMVFLGNGALVDTQVLEEWASLAEAKNIRITVVQHPGVMAHDSGKKPTQFDDLVSNGANVFKAIQKKYGLKADDIGLYGHSLGGAIATQVATRFYNPLQKECPYVFVDRSFSSLARTPVGWILSNKPKTVLGVFVFLVLQVPLAMAVFCILKPLLLLTGWEAHTGLHYALLPSDHKHHLFVRSRKKGHKNAPKQEDMVIPKLASLDSAFLVKIPYWIQKYWTKWFGTPQQYKQFKKTRAQYKIFNEDPKNTDNHNPPLQMQMFANNMLARGHGQQNKSAQSILEDWIDHKEKPRTKQKSQKGPR